MLDRRFGALGLSNLVGFATHAAGLGLMIAINGQSLRSIAIGSLIGYAGYYAWIIATIGRELWGTRLAVSVGLHAGLGALVTWGVVELVPGYSEHAGIGEAALQSAGRLAISLLLVTPLVAYGLWRTGVLRHFRGTAP
jgi:hypothetical protein